MAQEAKRDDDETSGGGEPPEDKDEIRSPDKDAVRAEPDKDAVRAEEDDNEAAQAAADASAEDEEGDDDGEYDDDGEVHAPSAPMGTVGTRTLGIERYVQAAYLGAALIIFWVTQKTIVAIWNLVSDQYRTMAPDTVIATVSAVVLGGAIAWGLYKNPRVYKLTAEVATELSKVTWPSRQETYTSTVVVIVTSIIAAVYLGVWDFVWSGLTDLIYKV